MNIIITGGAGYIGSNLIEKLLSQNHKIVGLYNKTLPKLLHKNLNWVKYDGSFKSLSNINLNAQLIIHLATVFSHKTTEELIENMINANIRLGIHLLEFAKSNGVEFFINTTTYATSINNSSYSPQNFYSATKKAFEDILKYYSDSNVLKSLTLSLFDVYGPNDPRPKFINLLINTIGNNEIFNMSSGQQNIRYVYIDDVIEAYCMSIELLKSTDYIEAKTFSVYGNENLTLLELVEQFNKVTESKLKTNLGL